GLGFGLQIVALRAVPIYAVGAALAASLAVTAVVAALLLGVRLKRAEWTAVAVVCAGLAMLGLASGAEGDLAGPGWLGWAMLGTGAAVLLLGAAGGRLPERARAGVLGLGAGLGFGVVEVSVRLIYDVSLHSIFTDPPCLVLLLVADASFLLLTSALRRGSVTADAAGLVLGETVVRALAGVVWLGDSTRLGWGWLAVLG